jgi:RsiW-degrading membrane proteinase PrsW (M82 family)
VAAVLVLLVETAIAIVAIIPLLWDQLPTLMEEFIPQGDGVSKDANDIFSAVKPTVGFYVLIFILAYISAGCCEEGMKYILATRVKKWTPGFRDRDGFLLYAVAGALGFSTVENIGYAFNSLTPWYAALVGVLTRVIISTPIHVCCAYLVGIGVVRRDVFGERLRLWRILAVPVVLHGSFDFFLMIAAATLESDSLDLLLIECAVVAVTGVALGLAIRWEKRKIAGEPPSLLPSAAAAGGGGGGDGGGGSGGQAELPISNEGL